MKRKKLSPHDIAKLIKIWDAATTIEVAEELGVSPNTIYNAVKKIRKISEGKYCKIKPKKQKTLEDTIVTALGLIEHENSA